jgi:hypothetical protein
LESEIAKGEDLVVLHGGSQEEIEAEFQNLLSQGKKPRVVVRFCAERIEKER